MASIFSTIQESIFLFKNLLIIIKQNYYLHRTKYLYSNSKCIYRYLKCQGWLNASGRRLPKGKLTNENEQKDTTKNITMTKHICIKWWPTKCLSNNYEHIICIMYNGKQIYVKISQVSASAPARRLSQCKQIDEKYEKDTNKNIIRTNKICIK